MVALLQRCIVYFLLLTSLGALLTGSATGHAALGLCAAVFLIFGYSLVLAAELVCLVFVEPSATRPALGDLIQAWWAEALVAPQIFYWRQPFRAQAEPDHLPLPPARRRAVLLVHGLVCNRGFWNPWTSRLRQIGVPVLAVDLEPVFGSIDSYADAIDAAVQRIESATGMSPVVVAHSMGGLAIRRWLGTHGSIHRVHRVITIGTPHRGTWLARFAKGPSGRQMAVDSEWLTALHAAGIADDHASKFTCFFSHCDNVVFPSHHARLEGADNRRVDRTAHVALAFHDSVFREVLRWLELPAHDQSNRSLGNSAPASSSPSDATRR